MANQIAPARLRDFLHPGIDVEVVEWVRQSFRDCLENGNAHAANAEHLRLRLRDPLFAESEAGKRAWRTVEFLYSLLDEKRT